MKTTKSVVDTLYQFISAKHKCCPRCSSEEIGRSCPEDINNQLSQYCYCDDCDCEWYVTWTATDVKIITEEVIPNSAVPEPDLPHLEEGVDWLNKCT